MSQVSKDTAILKITQLVERFEEQKDFYKRSEYNETLTRRDFIDPFFKALGWDVDNEQGYAESYREVIHEDKIKIGTATKAPDYSFRLGGGKRLFFVEAKKPSVFIKDDITPAYQVRRYGWSAKLPISIITDFEEFAIYDCTKKPNPADKASNARIKYLSYNNYLNEFDFLWETFSKEKVLKGSFDKFVQNDKQKKGTSTVDHEFLNSLDTWRTYLANNIALRNTLDEDELNFVVQHIIDRIIFLRIAEDRNVEPYGSLQEALKNGDYYQNLLRQFYVADQKYNSGLFDFSKDKTSGKIAIDNKVIKTIVNDLYYPISPYEFSVLSVEILGSAYEQFLGKQISLSKAGRAVIEEKPEVRKAGGVYYTPQYIVDYIVENTVGKLVQNKTPKEICKIKIVDPACGSGSFLIGAYQYLLTFHKDYYSNNGKPSKGNKEHPLTPEGNLTTAEKKRILLNNIYGVDLDANAVEVTKLSLLLKCMEGETAASIATQLMLFHERILPTLDNNIKSGNSLIDVDFYATELDFGEERKIKPFNWQKAFPEVFKQGGFDCVIGNPPYVSIKELNKDTINYLTEKYIVAKGQTDLYSIFIEKGLSILSHKAFISFIIPDSINDRSNFYEVRKLLIEKTNINLLCTLNNVFDDATVGSTIFVSQLEKNSGSLKFLKASSFFDFKNGIIDSLEIKQSAFKKNDHYSFLFLNPHNTLLLDKLFKNKTTVSEIAFLGRGEEIGKKSSLISNTSGKSKMTFVTGEDFSRYIIKQPITKFIERSDIKKDIKKLYCPKIIIRQVGSNITAALDEFGHVTTQSVYSIVSTKEVNSKYLLALLNSNLFNFIYQKKYRTKEIFPRILLENLKALPIVVGKSKTQKELIQKVISEVDNVHKTIALQSKSKLSSDFDAIKNKVEYYQQKINQLIYELYELTEEEIKVVEGA